MFSSVQHTHSVMVYQIIHDDLKMNDVPLITVEPIAELLRSSGMLRLAMLKLNQLAINIEII